MARTILAIDPGSSKCGMALVKRDDNGGIKLLWRTISPRSEVINQMVKAEEVEKYNMVVVGGGTTSKELVHELREKRPSMGLLVIDERDSTLQARERYWEHNPRRGWRRIIPSSLQMPPEPVDDFVALILAERVLLAS